MIYHLVVGDAAAGPLSEAVMMEPSMQGEIIALKDLLNLGPLKNDEGRPFSDMRSAFWNSIIMNEKEPILVPDAQRIEQLLHKLDENPDAKVWFWMAPWPADVCAYHWLLGFFAKNINRFFLLSIANLPFLDENGKVFYPKNISEILPKEIVKARRLARPVTMAEVELDGETWNRLTEENSGVRTHEGGKKLASRQEDYYDAQLASFCSHQFQKASRIISQALNKYHMPTGDLYLAWRLRKMAEAGTLQLQGDTTKTLKDYEVKLPGGLSDEQTLETGEHQTGQAAQTTDNNNAQ
jgi:hypothetical protein